jgi:hypothetical protein
MFGQTFPILSFWDFGLFTLLWAPGPFGTAFGTQVWVNLGDQIGCRWKVLSMGFLMAKEILT